MAESAESTEETDAKTSDETSDSTKTEENEAPPWGSDEDFNAEKAWNLIKNLRKDKLDAGQLRSKVAEYEKAKLTDQERLEKERDEAKKSAEETLTELARVKAAVRYGLDEEDLDLLGNGTAEEIDARAKRLSERLGTKAPPSGKPRERLRGGGNPTTEPEETDLTKIGQRLFKR